MRKSVYDITQYGKKHPKARKNCEGCSGRGWMFTSFYGQEDVEDGTVCVAKCAECAVYKWDETAARAAYNAGVNVRLTYPCVVGQPVRRASLDRN